MGFSHVSRSSLMRDYDDICVTCTNLCQMSFSIHILKLYQILYTPFFILCTQAVKAYPGDPCSLHFEISLDPQHLAIYLYSGFRINNVHDFLLTSVSSFLYMLVVNKSKLKLRGAIRTPGHPPPPPQPPTLNPRSAQQLYEGKWDCSINAHNTVHTSCKLVNMHCVKLKVTDVFPSLGSIYPPPIYVYSKRYLCVIMTDYRD